ncbi:MAG: tail-specific protease [Planctomycetes bacterium]|nr:tail-specific protease [Planctomycetota bacterium]
MIDRRLFGFPAGRFLAVALVMNGLAVTGWSEIPEVPPARDRHVAFYINSFLATQHLSKRALDDEVSRRVFKSLLEGLDPLKLYFLQSDIDAFRANETALDDQLKQLNTKFSHDVFRVYADRVRERMAWVEEILNGELDFGTDEEMVVDADTAVYAVDAGESRDRWRRRIKYDLLVLKLNKTEGQEARDTLRRRYKAVRQRTEQTDSDEVLERYMNALTTSFDPHSTYFSPGAFEDFRIRLGLNYQGIGAELENRDGQAIIRRIMPGGAAAKAGVLRENDRVVSVGQGEDGPMVDVVEMKLDDIIDLIRGKEGTVVRIGLIREGDPAAQTVSITRARIELNDSAASGKVFDLDWSAAKKADGSPFKVGVIDLPSFYLDMDAARHGGDAYKSSTRDVKAMLDDFKRQSVDAVVLDLRRNGGGSLSEAIGITGLFIDEGPVVQVKDSAGRVDVQSDVDSGAVWQGPLVVVISRFSASASEIVAGAIQDYRRGVIVGDESTHGKGTVQSLVEVGPTVMKFENAINLGAIKITMQQFYRPNGDSTQNRGVLSDITLPSLSSHIAKGEADLDYALAFDHVPAADVKPFDKLVVDDVVAKLREASSKRIGSSSDFAKLTERIARYDVDSARKTIPLNETKFMELRKQEDAEKTEREQAETLDGHGGTGISRNFYLDEVLAITAEYASAVSGSGAASP